MIWYDEIWYDGDVMEYTTNIDPPVSPNMVSWEIIEIMKF